MASLVVALGAGLHRHHPRPFFLLMAAIALLTLVRVYLLLRFDELYDRVPGGCLRPAASGGYTRINTEP